MGLYSFAKVFIASYNVDYISSIKMHREKDEKTSLANEFDQSNPYIFRPAANLTN